MNDDPTTTEALERIARALERIADVADRVLEIAEADAAGRSGSLASPPTEQFCSFPGCGQPRSYPTHRPCEHPENPDCATDHHEFQSSADMGPESGKTNRPERIAPGAEDTPPHAPGCPYCGRCDKCGRARSDWAEGCYYIHANHRPLSPTGNSIILAPEAHSFLPQIGRVAVATAPGWPDLITVTPVPPGPVAPAECARCGHFYDADKYCSHCEGVPVPTCMVRDGEG